mmetsp:Transcript_35428/g.104788  ORF Transcript_35428/g.104788 Transcript_35428/m.104788 type:complete len:426 (-) Transcript_35428:483-1760(-)
MLARLRRSVLQRDECRPEVRLRSCVSTTARLGRQLGVYCRQLSQRGSQQVGCTHSPQLRPGSSVLIATARQPGRPCRRLLVLLDELPRQLDRPVGVLKSALLRQHRVDARQLGHALHHNKVAAEQLLTSSQARSHRSARVLELAGREEVGHQLVTQRARRRQGGALIGAHVLNRLGNRTGRFSRALLRAQLRSIVLQPEQKHVDLHALHILQDGDRLAHKLQSALRRAAAALLARDVCHCKHRVRVQKAAVAKHLQPQLEHFGHGGRSRVVPPSRFVHQCKVVHRADVQPVLLAVDEVQQRERLLVERLRLVVLLGVAVELRKVVLARGNVWVLCVKAQLCLLQRFQELNLRQLEFPGLVVLQRRAPSHRHLRRVFVGHCLRNIKRVVEVSRNARLLRRPFLLGAVCQHATAHQHRSSCHRRCRQ